MLDDLFDRAWNCFNKLSSEKSHKMPPDKSEPPSLVLKKHENIAGLMTLDPGTLPDRPKLDAEFQDLLDELDLGPTKAKELSNQSPEKKWLMIMEQRSRKQNHNAEFSLESTLRQISEWSRHFPDKYSIPLVVQQLEALSVALRTESFSYVQGFIDKDGITLLSDLLEKSRNSSADSLGLPILSCFKALLNSSAGRNCVLERPQTLLAIVASLDFHSPRCQSIIVYPLSLLKCHQRHEQDQAIRLFFSLPNDSVSVTLPHSPSSSREGNIPNVTQSPSIMLISARCAKKHKSIWRREVERSVQTDSALSEHERSADVFMRNGSPLKDGYKRGHFIERRFGMLSDGFRV
uniref:Drf_GBD domain-containing protein n=1 Tax=Bursaphelenchus xylophilus TaxID=6326 RepID=A0A1I7RMP3_BURXY